MGLGPHFESSLCFFTYNIIRCTHMNLRCSCGAYGKPDTKDSIQAGLCQHDVSPGRYTAVEHAVQVIERFKSHSRLASGFGSCDKSENRESERGLGDKREIIRVSNEGSEQIVQLNALEINR